MLFSLLSLLSLFLNGWFLSIFSSQRNVPNRPILLVVLPELQLALMRMGVNRLPPLLMEEKVKMEEQWEVNFQKQEQHLPISVLVQYFPD